ncbi:MAG: winged helix-turn-helix domain-containing protein [Patescibacteria group bacterium]
MTFSLGDYKKLERIVKGFGSHRRLQILDLLDRQPGLSVLEIAEKLKMGYENASDHVRKMSGVGLLHKRHDGSSVRHTPTSRARDILVFCKRLK